MTVQELYPDFDQLWDYGEPTETAEKFQALLAQAQNNPPYHAELLTQLARTQGLQRKFDEAHQLLDQVEVMLTNDMARAHIRYLLERGRTFNSSGEKDKARALFLSAWNLGKEKGEDFHAIDAAHMMAIVEPLEEQLLWNLTALALTEKTPDQRAKKWIGSLNNNIGWTFFDQKHYEKALDHFYQSLAYQESVGNESMIRVGRWCVAKTLRVLGRVEEALTMQEALLKTYEADGEQDEYVSEEMGECLLALDRIKEARPHFASAYEALSQDSWLVEHEPDRIERIKQLGQASTD
ncbi:MAG: hypothetical protein AAF629_21755 [Chloroflexota bacterium]